MSISRKINTLVLSLGVLASVIFTALVSFRDFDHQQETLLLQADSRVGRQPDLQLTVYHRHPDDVQAALEGFLNLSPAVAQASLLSGDGTVLGEVYSDWGRNDTRPAFARLRDGLSPAEVGHIATSGGASPPGLNILKTLLLGERGMSITVPVVSLINPAIAGLSAESYGEVLKNPAALRSLHVLGYVNISVSNTVLWRQTLPAIALSAGLGFALIIAYWMFASAVSRRLAAPLTKLARHASAIAAGEHAEKLLLPSGGEIGEIATVLNGIITGMHASTVRADTDRKILSLKVDERSAQLSEHRQQLSEAERKANEAKTLIQQMAYFDPLTSLPNRRLFLEQLILLLRLATRNNQALGLVLIDIDNFKRINKSLGAAGGDTLLREIAKRLTTCVRDSDVLHRARDAESAIMDISRMGGDEFTVVLNQIEDVDAALTIANRLSEAISKPYQLGDQEVVISSSIGVALSPQHASNVEDLLRAADNAMLEAKKVGRNRIVLFDPSMQGTSRERIQLENELRRAIDHEQLVLHYQPQVHAQTAEVIGIEALVRWDHPEKGLIPPFRWIPVAEELGLIEQVGAWVLKKTCDTLVQLRTEGIELPRVSVNVSALQLQESFINLVQATLEETGLSADSLKLELTEGIMINSDEPTVQLVKRLRDIGVRLSIDDFGTGYSSLSYLSQFPLHELKIDRSFVKGLTRGEENAELVRAIIAMAKSLALDVVVEGVEEVEELMFFKRQNVHVIQGYLFSRPVAEERLRALLAPEFFAAQVRSYDAHPQNTSAALSDSTVDKTSDETLDEIVDRTEDKTLPEPNNDGLENALAHHRSDSSPGPAEHTPENIVGDELELTFEVSEATEDSGENSKQAIV